MGYVFKWRHVRDRQIVNLCWTLLITQKEELSGVINVLVYHIFAFVLVIWSDSTEHCEIGTAVLHQ